MFIQEFLTTNLFSIELTKIKTIFRILYRIKSDSKRLDNTVKVIYYVSFYII